MKAIRRPPPEEDLFVQSRQIELRDDWLSFSGITFSIKQSLHARLNCLYSIADFPAPVASGRPFAFRAAPSVGLAAAPLLRRVRRGVKVPVERAGLGHLTVDLPTGVSHLATQVRLLRVLHHLNFSRIRERACNIFSTLTSSSCAKEIVDPALGTPMTGGRQPPPPPPPPLLCLILRSSVERLVVCRANGSSEKSQLRPVTLDCGLAPLESKEERCIYVSTPPITLKMSSHTVDLHATSVSVVESSIAFA